MGKKNIALVMGGFSGEHDISIASGNQVYGQLDHNKYNVYKIVVEREGWYWLDGEEHRPVDRGYFTVSDNNQMYVYFSINEAQMLSMTRESGSTEAAISAMPEIKLILVDGSEYQHAGKVESVSGVVDRSTGTVQIRAVFDNPEKLLNSGSTGNVVIPTTYKDKIVIPATATVQVQDKFKVYLVDKDNIAHEQLVTTEPLSNGKEYVIKEGLKVGDVIVSEGAGMLRDGQNIKPNEEN